jgi:hypothetical protein
MMMTKVLSFFVAAGLAFASVRPYTVSLFETITAGTTELKAGDYKIEVNGQTAVIRNGKVQAEVPVRVEEGDTKFAATAVRYVNNADGKVRLQEIRIGGTKTKLVFAM